MTHLAIFSGGAAQGLARRLEPVLEAATGCRIDGVFSAVGGLRDRLIAGEAADVAILTAAIISELEAKGLAVRGDSRVVGDVETAVAIRAGDVQPDVASEADLRQALLRASSIYFPDPIKATAGIHFAEVLRRLGVYEETQPRHRTFPNGATAMAALARAVDARPLGCTQLTEIVSTPGIVALGALPGALGLSTTYVAALMTAAKQPVEARWLIGALSAASNAAMRKECGFA